jgi:membrane-associated phospholipid phosphatase
MRKKKSSANTTPAKLNFEYRTYRAAKQYVTTANVQSRHSDISLEVSGNKYAVFSKTLPHNSYGEVANTDWDLMLTPLITMQQSDFNVIPAAANCISALANPQAAFSYSMAGQDPQCYTMEMAPSISSEEAAGEMMEVYEKAMHRNISFATIKAESDSATTRAITTLNAYGDDFKGPKIGGVVTSNTLFRGTGPDEVYGPYVSQLLVLPYDFGNCPITQKFREESDQTSSTELDGWLRIQNGQAPEANGLPNMTGNQYYLYRPRDLASMVHNDPPSGIFFSAAQVILDNGIGWDKNALSAIGPREDIFTTFGAGDFYTVIGTISKLALVAAWHQKWGVHTRLRPEVMAGRIHFQDAGDRDYGIDLWGKGANTISAIKSFNASGTALLPLVYPEGSPTHPSYPAGHAVLSGACITVIKAFLDTEGPWPSTPKHSTNGSTLVTYTEDDASKMTIQGEINKVASNVSIARNMAGVHYRSDGDAGILLGEQVAISFLRDLKDSYNENFDGWVLQKLDGTMEVI